MFTTDMPSRRQKVLIVDDLPINVTFASVALEPLCSALTAYSGAEALQLAMEHQPDLILLDIRMPGMDGLEVCRRLKANRSTASIPVVFLTSLTDEENEEQGLSLGAIDYIAKPFSIPVLRARIRNHLELSRQRVLLERLSHRDGLTGIANRREFDKTLEREWQRMAELAQPLALLMIDVDTFKRYNDTCGHQAGDECLKRIARAIDDAMLRKTDLAARYGGEEFACVLPNTDEEGAAHVAESIRAAIASLAIPYPASPDASCVTVSIGVASTIPANSRSSAELVSVADKHLYSAKQAGRNRILWD
ncbi:diguanylate cyclase [Paralcaligenes sp. KSB-10]|uniref:diguanylate cyclase n=1 Tax=Paralcaligenes sp. KSB-10 TaxID=2901142 RepID=UPI001E526315|nr:diguanylate cyclase [Paralcaligenes sp. KSB-10]UHL65449.1 diguanylate cyclase [Paralcaligenes sp. KSB-10]